MFLIDYIYNLYRLFTGVDPLSVPTLLIGLTNKPSLIDPALMRPGRFEVKIEVPKPKVRETSGSLVIILKICP